MSKASLSVLCMISLFSVAAQADGGKVVKTIDSFRDTSQVPDDAVNFNVSTVKFVQVTSQETLDYTTCDGVNTNEPGGSEYCPSVSVTGQTMAIEVDFTYDAQSTSDEYGNITNDDYFYLNPASFTAEQIARIPAKGALKGKAAAAVVNFNVVTAYQTEQVIDTNKSVFCDTIVTDGGFQQVDPNCVDQIVYTTAQFPYTVATASLK